MTTDYVKRCTRCVLPETYPGIDFDGHGVCRPCREFRKPEVKGEAALRELLASSKGKKYDCIVTLSGGRDSSYVLYYAVTKLGLRVIALHYNNGFRHEQAWKNAQALCARLGVPLREVKSKDRLNERITRAAVHMCIPFGPGTATQFVCHHCYNGGKGFLYKLAEKEEIPWIMWGTSRVEDLSFQKTKHAVMNYKGKLRYLLSARALSFLEFTRLYGRQRNENLPSGNGPWGLKTVKLKNPDIREIALFDFVEWDRNETKRVLAELGWEKPADKISSWRFDCHLHPLVNYCYKKALGFNHDIDGLANMVRAGKMTRQEAMDHISKGFDSAEWTDEIEHCARDILELPESDIDTMKAW